MVRVEKYGWSIRLLLFLCMLPLVTPSSRHESQGTSVEAAIALPSGCALQLLSPVAAQHKLPSTVRQGTKEAVSR